MRHFIIGLIFLLLLAGCETNPPSEIAYNTLPETGDSVNGELLFTAQGCIACHMQGATGAPELANFADRAGSTVEGESAREYTFYAIVEPARHIAEGYGNAMPNTYDSSMTAQELADLIAYLLDL